MEHFGLLHRGDMFEKRHRLMAARAAQRSSSSTSQANVVFVVAGKGCSTMTDEDDSLRDGTGLIAQAIWDYWNVGSTKRLISVLRSESPLTSADRQLLADFIAAELKGSRKDSKLTLEYLLQPDKSLAKRSAAAEVERIIKELRDKTGKTHGHEKVAPIFCPPEKMREEFDEELRTLLRRLKKNQKDPS